MQQASEKSGLERNRGEALEKIKAAAEREHVHKHHESGPETGLESRGLDQEGEADRERAAIRATAAATQAKNDFAERERKIEKVLEQGFEGVYLSLPADKKIEFKAAGEKTAHQINLLLGQTKVKIKKVISLIKDWLKIIPGINRFFLEQEAKIKADELINLNKTMEGGDK